MQVRKEPAKESMKKMNARIERTLSTQAPWAIPDATFRTSVTQDIAEAVIPAYTDFWEKLSELNLFKTPAKYFKCAPSSYRCLFLSKSLRCNALPAPQCQVPHEHRGSFCDPRCESLSESVSETRAQVCVQPS